MNPTYFDTHAHLCHHKLWDQRYEVLERARAAGVKNILCVGYDMDSSRKSVELAEAETGVYAAVGVSPHDSKAMVDEDWNELGTMLDHPKVIACGETGLDYHYMLSPREVQVECFQKHLRMAIQVNKPIIIHLRDSTDDLFAIIGEEGLPESKGVLHCFTADEATAQKGLEFGLYISFSGIVTFAKESALVEVARTMDLSKMLIETDCPYLAPIPHRGKTCEPSMLPETAQKIADLRSMNREEVAETTTTNARRLFGI